MPRNDVHTRDEADRQSALTDMVRQGYDRAREQLSVCPTTAR
ncbi:MAG TPA: hypothetical protein PLH72_15595 [Vicinamibacterales bacterium]|mgnify:CR=1 FL=1|nr:hypothetical protein [Vicinamibacterales bacterium]